MIDRIKQELGEVVNSAEQQVVDKLEDARSCNGVAKGTLSSIIGNLSTASTCIEDVAVAIQDESLSRSEAIDMARMAGDAAEDVVRGSENPSTGLSSVPASLRAMASSSELAIDAGTRLARLNSLAEDLAGLMSRFKDFQEWAGEDGEQLQGRMGSVHETADELRQRIGEQ